MQLMSKFATLIITDMAFIQRDEWMNEMFLPYGSLCCSLFSCEVTFRSQSDHTFCFTLHTSSQSLHILLHIHPLSFKHLNNTIIARRVEIKRA